MPEIRRLPVSGRGGRLAPGEPREYGPGAGDRPVLV